MTDWLSGAALPELRIGCLGGFRATLNGCPVIFETDKGRALLAYLAVEAAQPQRREHLAGLLWSDQPEERALHNLRQTLSGLRKALGDEPTRPFCEPLLLIHRDTLQLNPARSIWLDVRQFQKYLQDALYFYTGRNDSFSNGAAGRGRLNLRLLERALADDGGAFLEGLELEGSPLFDEWASAQREAYHQQAVGALELLIDAYERRGEISRARQATERLAALLPWSESACSRLVVLYAQEGQWEAIEKHSQIFQRYLQDKLGMCASAEMRALFENVRQTARDQPWPRRYPLPAGNLPVELDPCTGRESELDDLTMLLADPGCRLLSLVGPSGSGKTCLALAAARWQVGLFADGVFFAPVASATASAIAGAIAEALGVSLAGVQEPQQHVLEHLRDKELLLALDASEVILADQAGEGIAFLTALLQQAAQVKLLVISPAALNLRSECVLEIDRS